MNRDDVMALRHLMAGAWATQAIAAAAKLKLADQLLDGPRTVTQLAESTETKPELLHRLLRALASKGIFKEIATNTFEQTAMSSLLSSDHECSLRNVAQFFGDRSYQAFGYFEHQLKTGEVAYEKQFDEDFFGDLAKDPERSTVFNRAMLEISSLQIDPILRSLPDLQGRICDLAGGTGVLLEAILKQNQKLQGILYEQSHTLRDAQEELKNSAALSRIEFVAGDFFQPLTFRCDTVLMKYIIHDWPDPEAIQILKNCRQAADRILVIEQMIPPGNEPLYTKLSDLMMMTSSGSAERTQQQFEELFEKAGLKLVKIHPTDFLLYIFELQS